MTHGTGASLFSLNRSDRLPILAALSSGPGASTRTAPAGRAICRLTYRTGSVRDLEKCGTLYQRCDWSRLDLSRFREGLLVVVWSYTAHRCFIGLMLGEQLSASNSSSNIPKPLWIGVRAKVCRYVQVGVGDLMWMAVTDHQNLSQTSGCLTGWSSSHDASWC